MKCGVKQIVVREGRAAALTLDTGEEIIADHVISSIGAPETSRLIHPQSTSAEPPPPGRLSFVETIAILDRPPADLGWGEDTIVFFNDSSRFHYERPGGPVDPRSGVICIPNNFDYGAGQKLSEGIFRCTCLANYDEWAHLPDDAYRTAKQHWFQVVQNSARRFLPPLAEPGELSRATVATDMFTPRTITKFTGHLDGAIYGSALKNRKGRTELSNLYLCGTDQGFLGIVGAMLSGISMANFHILQKG
jgi:phytoene dehydrogenase-like protein